MALVRKCITISTCLHSCTHTQQNKGMNKAIVKIKTHKNMACLILEIELIKIKVSVDSSPLEIYFDHLTNKDV